jgi:hypothetical protein
LKKNLYLITPCTRINNLSKLKNSINFSKIKKWIIVYNTEFVKKKYYFKDNKNIIELFHTNIGSIGGNSQRNFVLNFLNKKKNKNFFIYFLDDDNILHKNFYRVVENIYKDQMPLIYTFDQLRKDKMHINNKFRYVEILKGNIIKINHIDTAMFLPNFSLINNIRWAKKKYNADGEYIVKCIKKNKNKHRYLPIVGSHYNFLAKNPFIKIKDDLKMFFKNILKDY